jgi:CheY-like chemotaxis protein
MDVQMPEVDGLEASAIIRGYRDSHQPNTISMTANAMADGGTGAGASSPSRAGSQSRRKRL